MRVRRLSARLKGVCDDAADHRLKFAQDSDYVFVLITMAPTDVYDHSGYVQVEITCRKIEVRHCVTVVVRE